MNYKILILTTLILTSPICTNPITLDPSIKKAVYSLVRLSGIAAGFCVSNKLWKGKWDAQCKWALGIFGVGIASFFYKPTFSRAQEFIVNDRKIHPDLKNNSPTREQIQEKNKPLAKKEPLEEESDDESLNKEINVELIKLTADKVEEIVAILEEVAQVKTLSANPYKDYSKEFIRIAENAQSSANKRLAAVPLSPQEFVRYVLPCYNPPASKNVSLKQCKVLESLDGYTARFWRLNKYLYKDRSWLTELQRSTNIMTHGKQSLTILDSTAKLTFVGGKKYAGFDSSHKKFYKSWQALGYEVAINDLY